MSEIKGVILIGGPNKGTRMRPLTLNNIAKPLVPIAGKPMLYHPILALSKIGGLREVALIGSYDDQTMADFLKSTRREFPSLTITYLREYRELGTAGGLYHFRDTILPNLSMFFVINVDVCSTFPLEGVLNMHQKHRGVGTIMGVTVPKDTATKYGCIVHDPSSSQVMHYVEKPENWISSLINGGIYLFDKSFFDEVKTVMDGKVQARAEDPFGSAEREDALRLEQDIVVPLAASRKMFVYESKDPWRQIKSASSALPANALYLSHYAKTSPKLLTHPTTPKSPLIGSTPTIIAPVYIDPSADVDPSAKIGPNVSLGPHVRVGAGVRIKDAIVLEGTTVDKHACILNSIVAENCKIGPWARVDGEPEGAHEKKNQISITILATEVSVSRETCVRSCIVLPNKALSRSSYAQEVLL